MDVSKKIKNWIKNDYLFIIVTCLCLFTLLFVLNQQADYQNRCNAHWATQIRENCETHKDLCAAYGIYNKTSMGFFIPFNESFNLIEVDYENKNTG